MALPSPKGIYDYLPMGRICSDHLRSRSKYHLSSENTSEQAKYCALLGYPDVTQQDFAYLECGDNI